MGKWLLAILVIIVLVQVAKAAVLYLKDDPAAAIRGQPASAPAGDVKDLRDLLEPIRARYKVPALGAAVLHGDRVVALGATGVRKAGGATPVTPEDLWHIGSCTKAMTATLIATFVEEGKLSWDQEIGEFFRASGEQVHPDWDRVTLEHLLSHTAGVPGDVPPPLWAKLWQFKGTPTEARMELVRPTLAAKPKAAPGEKYEYSNTGYAIAGAMAELATGESWESLMGSRLYGPLGITTGGFGAPGTPGTRTSPGATAGAGNPWSRGRGETTRPPSVRREPRTCPSAIGPGLSRRTCCARARISRASRTSACRPRRPAANTRWAGSSPPGDGPREMARVLALPTPGATPCGTP